MKYEVESGFDKETYETLKSMTVTPRGGYMPMAYICSPFSGDEVGNMAKARVYSRLKKDTFPLPHIFIFLISALKKLKGIRSSE